MGSSSEEKEEGVLHFKFFPLFSNTAVLDYYLLQHASVLGYFSTLTFCLSLPRGPASQKGSR